MTGIKGIYMNRSYHNGEDNVVIRVEGENINAAFVVDFECLRIALTKDLGLEVKDE